MASRRGPPPGPSLLTIARRISAAVVLADATTISLAAPAMSFKLTMGMSPFLHVNRPLARCGIRLGVLCACEGVSVCVISNTQGTHGGTHGHTDTRDTDHTDNVCTNTVNVCTHATASQETGRHRYGATKSWWYLCRACHSGQLIEHHQWEHSWSWRRCVRSCLSMLSCLH